MRVGIIQSSFIPWRGYFDFIAGVDHFVFLDDVQYTKQDWRNRNRIKTPKGAEWVAVPVQHKSLSQLIQDTYIDYRKNWQKTILSSLKYNYARASHIDDALGLALAIEGGEGETISELNIRLTKAICRYLGISTPVSLAGDLHLQSHKTDRLIEILQILQASVYISGPSADAYLDKEAFRRNGIRLEYKSYDYEPYPQQWGVFDGAVTVLDLIANCGPTSKRYLKSQSPNLVVVP
ncbi:MAG: WbqC family protein [Armatimonadota bacterium]